jgi:Asp-tRNA(Asn)/Glu-tRNA(Gln) amidotransferase A subunit family amidase
MTTPVTTRTTNGLYQRSATELLQLYRSGAVSPVDVVRDVIARIEDCEPQLNATWAFKPDEALAMARASELRWLAYRSGGAAVGALEGVPVTLKDNIATVGVPTPLGTAATELRPALADAPPAARLREAGAVFVSKTTMPDYGMLSSGLSSFHKLARNPWDTTKNPGGSSAGAGAAAAAGYGPLHLGTDIGGSIRLPASWCGVVGFKPSLGRVPIQPPYAGRCAGPMTRTVCDTALMMASLSRPDARDTMSLPWQALDWAQLVDSAADEDVAQTLVWQLRGLRIGLLMDAGWGTPLSEEVATAVRAAAAAFERAGAIVEPLAPFSTRAMAEGMDRFWRMRSWLDFSALPAERQSTVLPYIADWVRGGAGLSGAEVFTGYSQMAALRDAAVAACAPFDYVISPVSPGVAFAAELASPLHDPAQPFEHIAYTLAYNMSEQPAVSVNCGFTVAGDTGQGLPIGLQIIGKRHDDLGVLRIARAFELIRGEQRRWPMG